MPEFGGTPLTITGGLIVGGIGAGLIIGALIGGRGISFGFCAGAALGFGTASIVRRSIRAPCGPPTAFQTRAMRVAIGAELLAFFGIGLFAHNWDFERLMTTVLFVVSAHFLIMALSHGPSMLGLGTIGLRWLLVAVFFRKAPIAEILIDDGVIKLIFGCWMAAPLIPIFWRPSG